MTERLEIITEIGGDRLVFLRLSGTLDANGATMLQDHAGRVLEAGRHLVINLANVSFMSSTGIGALLAINEDFGERGLTFRLSAPSRAVAAPLALLCVDRFISIHDSDDQACTDLAA